jgi:hypothetical protein
MPGAKGKVFRAVLEGAERVRKNVQEVARGSNLVRSGPRVASVSGAAWGKRVITGRKEDRGIRGVPEGARGGLRKDG